MKKIYILKKSRWLFMCFALLACTCGLVNAQVYVNGSLSTGTTTASGVTSPAGYTWSECQNPTGNTTVANTLAGAGAQIANNNSVADDFIIPAGPSWNLTKITVYAYSTGYAGATTPFNDVRIRIHDNNPFAGPSNIVFGDLTTNRFSASSEINVYRIFNTVVTPATAPGTTRRIWKIEANVAVTLAPGTYWLEFQTGTIAAGASNFIPLSSPVGVRSLPSFNAIQSIAGVWAALIDAGQGIPANEPTELAFNVDYTTGACAGTPVPGNTISTVTTVCPGINFGLSLQNLTPGSGVTYQWQSSPDGITWTNIAGATNSTYNTSLAATTYYQALVTCSGNTGTSTPVQVNLTPASGCYCAAGSPDVTFEKISNVTYNTINNSSTSTAGYENFTAITTTVVQQSTLPMTVTIAGPFATDQVIVWIDFNQNGNFTDPGERVWISAAGVGPHTGNITIPATSLLGPTRMRIRMHDSGLGPNATSCGNSSYGQVEDYTVNIVPCVPVTMTNPADATIGCGSDATFSVTATGSGPTYKWQERTSAAASWTDLVASAMYGGVTTNTLTITGAPVTMNGYQYRVVFTGYCRSTDFTLPATLTVNPLVANVNPSSATICNGSSQQLTITNITSPLPGSVNVASGPINVPIPDALVTGATHTLAVAGVPGSAIITGINVRFTIPHTYSGDLVIALKAPNGQVLNLDYYVSTTFPGGNGFLNTIISSQTSPLPPTLGSSVAPFSSTFRPDAQIAATANGPSGPTGYAATVGSFAGLYTTAASVIGNWTIAIYDGGAIDVGTLTSWDITINYLAGIPATGVWTGPAGTMFTDPTLLTPYTGTAANTIYVNPTATTNYSVVVTTPVCVSGPTIVPVTVANPIGTVTPPANAAVCVNGAASFTVATTAGNPISYQWQVSTDAGATWTNLANNSIYSGVTTATLSLTGVTSALNNNRYRVVMNVSACASSVTSAGATLTVNPLPVVVINAGPYTSLYPGITTTLTAAVSPNAAATYQWYMNGVAVTGANAATLVVDVDHLGDYYAVVNDVNGCENSSNTISITAAANNTLFIYPSPNTGQFHVRYQSLAGNTLPRVLTVYDSKGAKVYQKTFTVVAPYTSMDVDMSNYSKGIYLVELADFSGNRIKTGTVMLF